MDAALRFGLGHPLDAVAAALEAEVAVGPVAADVDDDLLEAAAVAGAEVVHVPSPAHLLGVLAVHLEQVADEQRRLLTAGAGAQLQ